MKLSNGERVHRNKVTVMPMPEVAIDNTNRLAKQQKYLKEGLEFQNLLRTLHAVDDNETDTTVNSTGVSDSDDKSSDDDDEDDSDYDPKEDPEEDSDSNNESSNMPDLHDKGAESDSSGDESSDDNDRPGL